MVENKGLIPNNQFGFRQRHSTIEQTHRIVGNINEALENKQYCSAAFLDISQAFDKVWHTGLVHKLRRSLPLNYFLILKSYLYSRHFQVNVETEYTELSSVNAGVSQGSVLGSSLYLICTADLPTSPESTTTAFSNNTAVLTVDTVPAITSQKLQTNLLVIQKWCKNVVVVVLVVCWLLPVSCMLVLLDSVGFISVSASVTSVLIQVFCL
jgi:hypothetical protein